MPTDPQSARFSEIAQAIVTQLINVTGVSADFTRLVASDNYDLYPIDQRWLVVRYYGPTPDTDIGVGRRARPHYRLIRVYIYSRSNVDKVGDDTTALTGDDAHADFEELVLDALDEYKPVRTTSDGVSQSLTLEPLHPLDSSSGPPERKPEDDVGVIRSSQLYQVRYIPPLRNPQP